MNGVLQVSKLSQRATFNNLELLTLVNLQGDTSGPVFTALSGRGRWSSGSSFRWGDVCLRSGALQHPGLRLKELVSHSGCGRHRWVFVPGEAFWAPCWGSVKTERCWNNSQWKVLHWPDGPPRLAAREPFLMRETWHFLSWLVLYVLQPSSLERLRV